MTDGIERYEQFKLGFGWGFVTAGCLAFLVAAFAGVLAR